ncbi:enoyl-CoA hydratase [Blastococcus sp. CT_GayMR20]|uniref:enoyl-CoA hydratase n=1 Tax=Blastococcus sp. CT_GayMR20 TaxID=2559609 RepID=UPI0010741237|nr:enoyl-CoA hydratase [Blastococcus sp. CT_GayMR20]TFV70578.1 enoyl-CoA hydratase [Blastococcus sp. CT_GayMR20]
MSDTGDVRVERSGQVWTLVLSNPSKRNAITWDMYDLLADACRGIAADPDVRVVVVRGDAEGHAFAAGTDIGHFTEFTDGGDGVAYEHRVGAVLAELLDVRVPVVALIDGPAVGAGLAIAIGADVVVATPRSTFGAPIARTLGNCLPPWVVARLQSRLGASRSMAMLLTARLIDAQEAHVAGLVHDVVPEAEIGARVGELAERICRSAPLTLAGLKEIDRRLQKAVQSVEADDILRRCYGSSDFRAGVEAFLAGSRPQWTGA